MRSPRQLLATLVVLGVLTAGCASNLSEDELIQANGAFSTEGPGATFATDAPDSDGASTPADQSSATAIAGEVGGPTAATPPGSNPTGDPGVTALAPTPGCSAASGEKEILLGTFGTEGGVIGANVATAPVGIRAWVADVNSRGGLCGHPVRVIFGGNDNGDPASAQAIARRLIEQDKVVAFLTPYSPTGMPAVYPIVEQRGIPVISDSSQVQAGDESPMSFKPAASLAGSGFGFGAAFATQTSARKVAVLSLAEVASAAVSVQHIRDNAEFFGYEIVYEAKVSLASPDFTAQMTEARNRGADVVVGVVDYTTMTKIIRSAQRQGYRPQFSGSLAFVTDAVNVVASEFEGTTAYSPTATYTTPQLADYRAAVAAYVPRGELGMLGPIAWAGGKVLERIAPKLDADPSSAEIVAALYGIQNETLGGIVPSFSFTKRNGTPYLNLCIQPARYIKGQWTVPNGADKFTCRP